MGTAVTARLIDGLWVAARRDHSIGLDAWLVLSQVSHEFSVGTRLERPKVSEFRGIRGGTVCALCRGRPRRGDGDYGKWSGHRGH
jgi:hypothetical protein